MASSTPVAYLDSSAQVKLVAIEAETAALRRELSHWPHRVASRSLDAIHLATAASIAHELGALITYDQRMLNEGRAQGLPVLSPR